MKKFIEEVECEGLDKLIGERITIMCSNYFYTGKLMGVNSTCILLTNAAIIFETGPFNTTEWEDSQALPNDWYIQINSIESFGLLK